MPRPNSVIRRYTPPTCTLEILAQNSPLSKWMGQTVIKQLRFQLHFDDPTLPEESKVPIQGDQDQLEALCHAVTHYTQKLLQQSADNFCFNFLEPQKSNTTSEQPELSEVASASSLPKIPDTSGMSILEATIYVEASDHLTHKLFLGSLGNATSGPVIQLTLLQLFDLANALDEYSTDVITLPNLKSESSFPSLPSWTPIAAMIVLALGLTPLTWHYANNIRQNNEQTAKKPATTADQIALESSPSLNNPPTGINTPGILPTPPNNTATLQIPNLDPPPPPIDPSLTAKPLDFPNATVPATNQTLPKNLTIPQTTKPVISSNLGLPLPTTQGNLPQNSTRVITQSGINSTNRQNLPPTNTSSFSNIPSNIPASVANLPNETQAQASAPITSQPDSQPLSQTTDSSGATSSLATDDNLVAKLRSAKNSSLPTDVAAKENTLFDIPQVAEAREYLQKRWQPPAGFSQTLEYSLMLGVDGSVERILPLNRAAREYVNSTGIPEIGKAFVSTNKSGQNIKLRAVFSPDGKVQTFPETP
ncbi:DUF4335 domain-containing protein [Anabaena azotica]|uniref:DUF4335 domain-containing protein n=1 Tax=Anabaena azotica TaxID=197653 RepID=UPI0039A69AE1